MKRTCGRQYVLAVLVPLGIAATFATARAQGATRSQHTGVSRADLFIASFGPATKEPALRTSELEMREQVRLAFYGIDATRVEVEKGRLSKEDGDRIIDSFDRTLRNYVHDQSNDALIVASTGQAQDIPRVAQALGALMGVARQDALMGREEIAQQAQEKMVETLRRFSQRFSETCEQQTFPADVALALQRQNDILGTAVDVTHCANRLLSATLDHRGVRYRWENCSIDGGGQWKLTVSGFLSGEGRADDIVIEPDGGGKGLWRGTTKIEGPTIRGRYVGRQDKWVRDFAVRITGRSDAPASAAAAPNDAGPNARPNGWPRAPVPQVAVPTSFKVGTLRMAAILVIGDGYLPTPDPIEGPIQLEERACTRP